MPVQRSLITGVTLMHTVTVISQVNQRSMFEGRTSKLQVYSERAQLPDNVIALFHCLGISFVNAGTVHMKTNFYCRSYCYFNENKILLPTTRV